MLVLFVCCYAYTKLAVLSIVTRKKVKYRTYLTLFRLFVKWSSQNSPISVPFRLRPRDSTAAWAALRETPLCRCCHSGPQNAVHCIGQRSALHSPSQHAASAIAPHCNIWPGTKLHKKEHRMSGHAPASSACLGYLSSVGPALSPSLPLPPQSIRGAVFSRTGAKCPDLHKQMRGARSRNGECAPPGYSDQSQALRPLTYSALT